ncbi:MAG: GTP cyclohydrolase I FolE [Chloroflexi bacterium]|nr:GTP cyclohydrolase I FolE [Chloroflexota bacterium]
MEDQDKRSLAIAENIIQQRLESADLLTRYGLDSAPVDEEAVRRATKDLLFAIGENPGRQGLIDTPKRVAKAYQELVSGYTTDPVELLNNAVFDVDYDDMVIVSDISIYSLCEHHLLPFVGHAHVAYIPRGKVVGLSKIPRIVDMFSRRLQVQERLTRQIAEFLIEVLEPKGVAVVMTTRHMCSMIRGVMKHESNMTTSAMLGDFRHNRETRNEFLMHIQRSKNE